jgi:hypothetical protein
MSGIRSDPPVEVEGVPLVVPQHLVSRFEEAEEEIKAAYGVAPGVPTLVCLWLACGNPVQIRHEFEMTVLGIAKPGFEFENDGDDNNV